MAADSGGWGGAGGVGSHSAIATFTLTARVDPDGEQLTVLVEGELDLATAGQLKRLLDDELSRRRAVVLDLSGVPFIDSSGLAAIVAAMRRSENGGGNLRLGTDLQPQARRLMELTGLLGLLESRDGA
jgi:anti-anti-sigma factor